MHIIVIIIIIIMNISTIMYTSIIIMITIIRSQLVSSQPMSSFAANIHIHIIYYDKAFET